MTPAPGVPYLPPPPPPPSPTTTIIIAISPSPLPFLGSTVVHDAFPTVTINALSRLKRWARQLPRELPLRIETIDIQFWANVLKSHSTPRFSDLTKTRPLKKRKRKLHMYLQTDSSFQVRLISEKVMTRTNNQYEIRDDFVELNRKEAKGSHSTDQKYKETSEVRARCKVRRCRGRRTAISNWRPK